MGVMRQYPIICTPTRCVHLGLRLGVVVLGKVIRVRRFRGRSSRGRGGYMGRGMGVGMSMGRGTPTHSSMSAVLPPVPAHIRTCTCIRTHTTMGRG